jgi:hypothetical protein
MKRILILAVGLAMAAGATAFAQTTTKGMAFNGATGLISTPTAQIGWEHTANVGLDFGYHVVFDDGDVSHLPKATVSLFRKGELGIAYDSMARFGDDSSAFLIHGKFQFFKEGVSAAGIGTNIQLIDRGGDDVNAVQVYLVGTYGGAFFGMPAATTVVFGKTFSDQVPDGDIDFSMGFEMTLFPEVFRGYVHWINDFANYSYSIYPSGGNPWLRGAYNTGIRIAPLGSSQYKFVIDAILADVFDDNDRAFSLGATFGLGLN